MTNAAICETFRELMTAYDAKRKEWIARFGSDAGFGAWFTGQVVCNESTAQRIRRQCKELFCT